MSDQQRYHVIGLMSGTSLDGLDVAYCSFAWNERWHFQILAAETIAYSDEWRDRLSKAHTLSGLELTALHVDLGNLHGDWVNHFVRQHQLQPNFIASHGHTVFHQPERGITLQIGSAPHIAAATGVDVVSDFRSMDVALGGQGAPLVPIGDIFLFGEYPLCLNLGGIANVSVKRSLQIEAYDISLCNIALNHFAEKLGFAYDAGGKLARSGSVDQSLLDALNALAFFHQPAPKSLGKEFWLNTFLPTIESHAVREQDALCTLNEHIAIQIASSALQAEPGRMLVTGGGAHNMFLLERLATHTQHEVVVPEKRIVDFKEALIFAFLGVLRMNHQPNALTTVTGSVRDSIGGAVYCAR